MDRLDVVRDEARKCNRCGYCQETCPVFAATGVESSVARGRIALVRAVQEGRFELTEDLDSPLFECLLCRACVAVCAPGAETDRIVAAARSAWRRRFGSPAGWRLARQVLLDRDALIGAARALFTASRLGLPRLAQATGLTRLFPPGMRAASELVPEPPSRFLTDDFPAGPSRAAALKAGYFVSCGMNLVQPAAARDAVTSLMALGCDVEPLDNCCCGLPAFVAGESELARDAAVKNLLAIEARDDLDVVVTECGSCSSNLRRLPELVPEELRERAERAVARVRDYSELLSERPWPEELQRVSARVTYHDPCHLSRHQSLTEAPRQALSRIPGLQLVEMADADRCCGGAGTYVLAHNDVSHHILERKMESVAGAEAELLVTSCPACMIQLAYGIRRQGLSTRVAHLSSLVARALGAGEPEA